jgi:hypothetical protein
MTKLEKRQVMLLERYQKQGISRFVIVKGSLSGLMFAMVDFIQPDTFPEMPSYFEVLSCLMAGWLFGIGLWFFVMWYFGRIKKRLDESADVADGGNSA